jgi:hypothetical protein
MADRSSIVSLGSYQIMWRDHMITPKANINLFMDSWRCPSPSIASIVALLKVGKKLKDCVDKVSNPRCLEESAEIEDPWAVFPTSDQLELQTTHVQRGSISNNAEFSISRRSSLHHSDVHQIPLI